MGGPTALLPLLCPLYVCLCFVFGVCVYAPHLGPSAPYAMCVLRMRDIAILPMGSPPCHVTFHYPHMEVVRQRDTHSDGHTGSETIDSIEVKNTQLTFRSLPRPNHSMMAQRWWSDWWWRSSWWNTDARWRAREEVEHDDPPRVTHAAREVDATAPEPAQAERNWNEDSSSSSDVPVQRAAVTIAALKLLQPQCRELTIGAVDWHHETTKRSDSILAESFRRLHLWLQAEASTPPWARSAQALAEHRACYGWLLHYLPGGWGRWFGQRDVGWHLSTSIRLQAAGPSTGARRRSQATVDRRRAKRQNRGTWWTGSTHPAQTNVWTWSEDEDTTPAQAEATATMPSAHAEGAQPLATPTVLMLARSATGSALADSSAAPTMKLAPNSQPVHGHRQGLIEQSDPEPPVPHDPMDYKGLLANIQRYHAPNNPEPWDNMDVASMPCLGGCVMIISYTLLWLVSIMLVSVYASLVTPLSPKVCTQPLGSRIMWRPARRCSRQRWPQPWRPHAKLRISAPCHQAPLIYRDPYPVPSGTLWDAPHDGNCQWHALNRSLGRPLHQWKHLKAQVLANWTPARLRTCGLTRKQSKQVHNALPHYRQMHAWGDKITLWLAANRLRIHIDVYHGDYRYQIDPTNQLAKQQSSGPRKRRVALQLRRQHYQTLLHSVDTNPAVHAEPIVMGTSLQGGAGNLPDHPTRNPLTPPEDADTGERADQPNPEEQPPSPAEDEDALGRLNESDEDSQPEADHEGQAADEQEDDDVVYVADQHDEAAFMVTVLRVRYPWANVYAQNPFGWRFWLQAGPARNLIRRTARLLHIAQARICLLTMAGHAIRSAEFITEACILRLQILPYGRERSRSRSPPPQEGIGQRGDAAHAAEHAPVPVEPNALELQMGQGGNQYIVSVAYLILDLPPGTDPADLQVGIMRHGRGWRLRRPWHLRLNQDEPDNNLQGGGQSQETRPPAHAGTEPTAMEYKQWLNPVILHWHEIVASYQPNRHKLTSDKLPSEKGRRHYTPRPLPYPCGQHHAILSCVPCGVHVSPCNCNACAHSDWSSSMLRGGGGRGRPRKNSANPPPPQDSKPSSSHASNNADTDPPHTEHTVHLQETAEEATLRCTWIAGRNRWRWQLARGANRWANVDAYTRPAALKEWLRRHSHLIQEQDRQDLLQLQLTSQQADATSADSLESRADSTARGSAQAASPTEYLTVEQCRNLLSSRLPCHRLPPTNCKVAFQALCHDLFGRATKDPRIAHVLLVLPKLILTTPASTKASKQRERHIRYNIDCARANNWQQLYCRSHECQTQNTPPDPEPITDDDPTDVTSRDISRLIKHAMQGEPIKGWKELHSPGLASPTPENFSQAMAKLRPHKHDVPALPPTHGVHWQPATDRIAPVILKLRRNRARDPGGWSHELLIWLWHNPNNREEIVKWIHHMVIGSAQKAPSKRAPSEFT